ncbi:hypothetical protein BKN38_03975 [Helicobacter sp. CLO-3]|uniref:hypothetical protein n=1 Tax=unclassified Helicobacter TaxID=2593540 RepID=UPI000804EAE0|nr:MULTISPECIES: hypothetical protein [unclassified Helicobacter]OBV29843.1 hypothetical protein BA723_03875 [Helicobacter sp. CLO-3]OHU84077.1 hypothetical protein BKN38_03975 [Helicobacter sp. CLO-3]
MKIFYMVFVLRLFAYADNFKNIIILKLDKPTIKLSEIDKDGGEYYINAIRETCDTQIVQHFHKENIIKFFQFAKEYDSYQAASYCHFPCRITGKVKLDSAIYDFELNEGGFAVLKDRNEKRYFGDEKLYGECGI